MAKKLRVKVFDDLRQSLVDAAAFEQGKPVNLRTQEIPPPPRRPQAGRDQKNPPCVQCQSGALRPVSERQRQYCAELGTGRAATGPGSPEAAHHRQETSASRALGMRTIAEMAPMGHNGDDVDRR
jgi:hypothetical protein